MAQLEPIHAELLIDLDFSRARRHVKRAIAEAQAANRELADLAQRLDTMGGRLARFGITLEVEKR